MISFLIRLAISAATLLFIAGASGHSIIVSSWGAALVAAVVIGLLNAFIKPIIEFLLQALTMPLSCITLGLWSLVLHWLLNALMFFFAGRLLGGFEVRGFWPALWGSLVLSIVNAVASGLFGGKKETRRER